ncbi:MAG: hypothetical protein ACLU84_01355 [Clostridia bacterium]
MMKRKHLIVLMILVLLVILLILMGYYIFISINYVPRIYSIEESNSVENKLTNNSLETLNITSKFN